MVAVGEITGGEHVSESSVDGSRFALLFTIANGRITREQAFQTRDEALEAAGLRD